MLPLTQLLGRLRLTGFMAYEALAELRARLTPSLHVKYALPLPQGSSDWAHPTTEHT